MRKISKSERKIYNREVDKHHENLRHSEGSAGIMALICLIIAYYIPEIALYAVGVAILFALSSWVLGIINKHTNNYEKE